MTNTTSLWKSLLATVAVSGLMLTGCKPKDTPGSGTPEQAVELTKGEIEPAEETSFEEVTGRLDPGGNLYAYLSTERWLTNLSAKLQKLGALLESMPDTSEERTNVMRGIDVAQRLVDQSGIEEISGLGVSSIALEPGFYHTKFLLHHYKGKGSGYIWSLFGREPHDFGSLALLSTNVAIASFSDFDLAGFWKVIQQEVRRLGIAEVEKGIQDFQDRFRSETGHSLDEMLASLGGNYGFVLTLDEGKPFSIPTGQNESVQIPMPGLMLVLEVKSDLLFQRIDEGLKENEQVIRVDQPDLKMRTMPLPLPIPFPVRPTVAQSGNYLFLASSELLIQEALAAKDGTQAGLRGTEEFQRLSRRMPTEGNHFLFVSARLARAVNKVQEKLLQRETGSGSAAFKSVQEFFGGSQPGFSYAVAQNTDSGWLVTGNGNQEASQMLAGPALIVPVAIGAGLVLPALQKARAKAQEVKIRNNLRQIELAKEQWARENNKPAGTPVSENDLAEYLAGGVKSVAGESYTLNPVGTPPTATLTQNLGAHSSGTVISP